MCKSIPIGTELICPICGNTFVNTSRSRPREYCSDNCKNLNKFLSAFERCLLKVDFKGSCSNKFKGEIMRRANLIRCVPKKIN